MKTRNFSRSNVNESTLSISPQTQSGYDLSHRSHMSLPLGVHLPVNIEKLMPASTLKGSVNPDFMLRNVQVPAIGRTRLDIQTFALSSRRINKDFTRFFEGASSDGESMYLPNFNMRDLFETVLGLLLSVYDDPTDSSDQVEFKQFKGALLNYIIPIYTNGDVQSEEQVAFLILYRAWLNYRNFLNPASVLPQNILDFGYTRDWISIECARLSEIMQEIYSHACLPVSEGGSSSGNWYEDYKYWSMSTGFPQTPGLFRLQHTRTEYNVAFAIYSLMKPYFGEGSIFDMINYPIFGRYSLHYTYLRNVSRQVALPMEMTGADWSTYFTVTYSDFNRVFDNSAPLSTHLLTDLPIVYNYTRAFDDMISEMPVRACYAAWYDQLRNWHVEKRSQLIDPDSWDSVSEFQTVIDRFLGFHSSLVSAGIYSHFLFTIIQLLIPRYSCYSRDFYTTIQTDDIFRYVFSPSSNVSDKEGNGYSTTIGSSDDQFDNPSDFQRLYRLFITYEGREQMSQLFPAGMFSSDYSQIVDSENRPLVDIETIAQDLQTMRRSGMLEKWLARNYYYPDTYAGQMLAHYDVLPSDLMGVCSQYIGGSDSFVSGKQEIGNVATTESPTGVRTYVGGAKDNGSFIVTSNGDVLWVVSFLTLVPLPTYNCLNMHAHEISRMDCPFPEFATDARIEISPSLFMRDCENAVEHIGYVPRYYQYRVRGDEAHGDYLTTERSLIWLHDTFTTKEVVNSVAGVAGSQQVFADGNGFSLTAYNQHIHLPLDGFLNLRPWDSVVYGPIEVISDVVNPLPGAVEFI